MNLKTQLQKNEYVIIFILSIFLGSCFKKKNDLNVIENNEIRIEQYDISEITTIHEFIDLTDKRWNKTEQIYEGNTESIDSVYIENDTIFLTSKYDEPIIYDLSALKFGYHIRVIKE